jgi:hypothetical protein
MRFMAMVRSAEKSPAGPPPKALFEAIAKLGEEAAKAGVFVQMGGLGPTAQGAIVSLRGGEINVTDGPFTEAKEIIGGFAVYELPSKEAALKWARRFMELHRQLWPGWEGESEIRQMYGPSDMPPMR